MKKNGFPKKQGLYDPQFEKDSCGVGFVCDIKGRSSHKIVEQGLAVLRRLTHRGAVGADPETGDGAGLLLQMPHSFFKKAAAAVKIDLPSEGEYGAGLVFLPPDIEERLFCKEVFYKAIKAQGQTLLGWRPVPVNNSAIGKTARRTQPRFGQVFIGRNKSVATQIEFERKLYLIRKQVEKSIRSSRLNQKSFFYITNLSCRTFSYKGLLMPRQLDKFFPDLTDRVMTSAIALVHSRYSTNTHPTWDLAQPFRFLAHNGEINTLRGNINWMKAREGLLQSPFFGKDIEKLKPILVPDLSDSATMDNAFELLFLGGRPLWQVMMMLIPAAWEKDFSLDKKLRDFYKYHACIMEPWDGPAAIAVTDGVSVGACLDRNGLRPGRYIVTKDGLVVMASEVGVLDIAAQDIKVCGRLKPGKMFYIDTKEGRIVTDEEVKSKASSLCDYSAWIKSNMLDLARLPKPKTKKIKQQNSLMLMKVAGITREDLKMIVGPMAETGVEPTGSMGCDIPLAIFSKKSKLLFNYFKQLFAQVTNPAIDPIREDCVMSYETFLGPQKNILDETPHHCRKLRVENPILTNEELEKIRAIKKNGFKTKTISTLFKANENEDFLNAIDRICKESVNAIRGGYTFIVLSDRGINKDLAALPAPLAVGAVHHHLVRESMRAQISIIVESIEPREAHHYALLFGYGADCVNPRLAYETISYLINEGNLSLLRDNAIKNYRQAVVNGILKILSKMGISTLQSYRGAQIFEALGVSQQVIDRCFTGTSSRIGGVGFMVIREETLARHSQAFTPNIAGTPYLSTGGLYQWRKDGEFHLWNPESISALQDATRKGDYNRYKEFSQMINDQTKNPTTLRSLFKFKEHKSISINKVQTQKELLKRFVTGAMSFGSISAGAHQTLAIAMNRLGGKSNTGEGGEEPLRFKPFSNGDCARSAIKQVASGRFGVTTNYLVNADEIQIKIAQGAKPGEGGQLPGHKVSATIARIRYTTPGVMLISPPPHHDIYSIEDLAQLIFDLKNVNPRARISVKLVSEVGVGTIAAGVAKGHADMILISGGDGGTGASPMSSIQHAGLPWELGVSETHQTLILNDLRSRVRLQTDGQMRTGRDVAIAALLGAQEFGFCTSVLIVMGCVMLRHCHLNNCSVGVATQDDILQKRFCGNPDHVENYIRFIVQELREIMARIGVKTIDEMVGRTDLLEVDKRSIPSKARGIDYSKILYKPEVSKKVGKYWQIKQNHQIANVLDKKLIRLAKPALEKRQVVQECVEIKNSNRTTGAMLSGEVCRNFGEEGLAKDTIHFKFNGVAGQSFGAWLACGVTFELEGLANDYVGKGMFGGKIIIYPPKTA
ncbi:MAG: glutamate synthase large subunit, partial [Candidatus Omnitrophota bacterium]